MPEPGQQVSEHLGTPPSPGQSVPFPEGEKKADSNLSTEKMRALGVPWLAE